MNYEHLIPTLSLPDPDDRHVLAAALHSGARVLVTFNLRHFPASALAPLGIIAQHPDDFLAGLVKAEEDDFVEMARLHRARLLNPPKDSAAYIATLRQSQLMQVADLLTRRISDI